MIKVLFFGDSICDIWKRRDEGGGYPEHLGCGFVHYVGKELECSEPLKYLVLNEGIGGNTLLDLLQRVKPDVWSKEPDIITIHIGTNDVWQSLDGPRGVELPRFERLYRSLLDDTFERLPNAKIILSCPFLLDGSVTHDRFEQFSQIKKYAEVVKKIAKDYKLPVIDMQKDFEDAAKKYGSEEILWDGIHPNIYGASLLANKWLKVFKDLK